MLESKIQSKVTSYLKKLGHPYVKTQGAGSRGWPDITAVVNSRMVCIEMKAPGGKPTAKQQAVAEHIKSSGGIWVSYDNADDCYELIDYVENLDEVASVDYSKIPSSLRGKDLVYVTV